jgi:2-polyprenyl-6-methoxyphenol hydroxylase-like FAD-dependent oxidoreductase
MNSDPIYDVVQIGYGPVGQINAALLGRQGHSIAVFERHNSLYALPRAGHIDHEIVRIFQAVGAAERVLEDAFRCSTYGWRNQHGEALIDIDWSREGISGWASDYLMYQPYMEDALDAAVRRHRTVSIHRDWEAIDLKTHPDHVEVTFARIQQDASRRYVQSGERRTVRGRYLIGADGANSFTRQSVGIEFEDLGFREQWLVTDFRAKRHLSFAFDNGQICDPARPLCLFQLGKTHRRFEFMVLPGEDPAQIANPDNVWSLVSKWITPQDAELIRSTVYTFRSANARNWRAGRVLIAGDAAHLMPPFLGQGMCSGVRDVTNLAWKLDLVLRGLAGESLLDSYTLERKAHVGSIIEQAVALGKVSCTVDLEEAKRRDEAFFSGRVPPPPPFPWITQGILQDAPSPLIGRLGPQAHVEFRGRTGLADDVVGQGWQLICKTGAAAAVGTAARQVLKALDVHILELDGPDGVRDVHGVYRTYLADAGVDAVLVRPDFYVFGAVGQHCSLDDLLADLAERMALHLPVRDRVVESESVASP